MSPHSKSLPLQNVWSVNLLEQEFLREGLRTFVQTFIQYEINALIEAAPHERSHTRRTYRNGYRRRTWSTTVGTVTIEIPKLRKGSYYPSFLDSLRDSESDFLEALHRMNRDGVSNQTLVNLLGQTGLPQPTPSQLAEIAEEFHNLLDRFRRRSLHLAGSNRPVAAIATTLLDSALSEEFTRSRSMLLIDDNVNALLDALPLLQRLRRAHENQQDAVAA